VVFAEFEKGFALFVINNRVGWHESGNDYEVVGIRTPSHIVEGPIVEVHLVYLFVTGVKKLEVGLAVIGVAGFVVEITSLDQSSRPIGCPMHDYFLSFLYRFRMHQA
jgi:hypothetical protein